MEKKDLRKFRRKDLLELLLRQTTRIKELEDEVLKLNEELNSKKILMKESGSIAEASLKLNHMFEDAQKSIDDYVNNVKAKYEEMLKEAEKKPITKSKENSRKKVKVTIKNSSVKKR